MIATARAACALFMQTHPGPSSAEDCLLRTAICPQAKKG